MGLIAALVFIPLAVAVLLMLFRTDRVRDVIVVGFAAIIAVVSVATAVAYLGKPTSFAFTPELSLAGNYVAVAVDLFLCGFVFVQGDSLPQPHHARALCRPACGVDLVRVVRPAS